MRATWLARALRGDSLAAISADSNVHHSTVQYWRKKLDPAFHPDTHGGARNITFASPLHQLMKLSIIEQATKENTTALQEYTAMFPFDVSRQWVSSFFSSIDWSFKKPKYKPEYKFTAENVEYYQRFVIAVQNLPWVKLKYLDEAHFKSKDLRRRHAVSPVGQSAFTTDRYPQGPSYSCTVMTSLDPLAPHPLAVDLRLETNTGWDFFAFILDCVRSGFLKAGDILLCDNASVHKRRDMLLLLDPILMRSGIRLVFLPKYSPELNPVEKVWLTVKTRMRATRRPLPRWHLQILAELTAITYSEVFSFYEHCMFDFMSEVGPQ